MAPNVTAHFFAANQPNGDVIHEITDEDTFFRGLKLSPERDGLGSADLVLSRSINFAGFGSGTFREEVFVRFLVHAYSDTVYFPWAFSLSKRQQTVVHVKETGEEVFRFGGPGPKSLLQRHALRPVSDLPGEWNLDLANGVWRWTENATIGQILNRVLNEDQARPNPSLGFLTTTFTASKDSNAVDWADADIVSGDGGLYEIPIGTDYLTILRDFGDLVELSSWIDLGEVDAPKFELNVIQGTRHDYTGSAVGAGVCLLKEGLNIANDSLEVEGQSLKKASHVIVEGKDGHWVIAQRPGFTPGDYVKIDKIEYSRSASDYWLDKAGIRWLKRQDLGEKEYTIEIVPGANDAAGLYFPAPDRVLWLDNLISVDTSADGTTHSQLDIAPSEDQLVTGLELELGRAGDTSSATAKARSWNVKAILNRERSGIQPKSPGQGSGSSGGGPGGGGGLKLCKPATEGTEPTDEATTLLKFYDANDGGDAINWDGILANQGGDPGDGAEGSSYYYFKSTAPEQWQDIVAATPGVKYRFTGYFTADSSTETLKVGFFSTGVGSPGNSAVLIGSHTVLASGVHSPWFAFSKEVVAPEGTVGWALGRQGGGPAFDRIRVYSVDVEASEGTEGDPGDCPEDVALECAPGTGDGAARCDHVHAHGNLSDDEAHHHNADDIEGISEGGGGTNVDYAHPDTYPASPDTVDDEFEGGGSLDAKWTVGNDPGGADSPNQTDIPGILHIGGVENGGTDNVAAYVRLTQTAPTGTATARYRAKVCLGVSGLAAEDSEFFGVHVSLIDVANGKAVGSGAQVNNGVAAVGMEWRAQSDAAGSIANMATAALDRHRPNVGQWFYLELRKTTTAAYTSGNTYESWMSFNGIAWFQTGTVSSLAFTATPVVGLTIRRPKSQTGTARGEVYVDYFRKVA